MKKNQRAKLIYNPHAGKKKVLPGNTVSLEDIKDLLTQYQIEVDYFPTKSAGHARDLARDSAGEGYQLVIAAGGDGTVGEVIQGLVGTDVTLAIIPLGTVMNVARMLSIPFDAEKAVALIKINRSRKIDVASITKLNGEKVEQPYYFLEQAGLGIEARMHYHLTGIFERREYFSILEVFKTIFRFAGNKVEVNLDNELIETSATMVAISNGPFGGAAFKLAPGAKLNDHRLTVAIFNMSKLQLTKYLFLLKAKGELKSRSIKYYQAEKVKVNAETPLMVHADARIFGQTPVEFKVVPNALNVITGFPKEESTYLNKRTELDP